MSEMLRIRDLTKRFGALTAVDDISLAVDRGEVLGFLGPNGAGKSTTMKMVTGFLPPTSGTAEVCGFDVTRDPIEVKRRVGYLPEGAPLYEDMTPAAFLNFVSEVRGIPAAERAAAIERAAGLIHIGEVMLQPIGTLSKGYKRRVGLAQAIVHDPEVLILDEPTDGLDPNQKHEVRELIAKMAEDKAIVISTHLLEEVEAVCTRAVIISRGKDRDRRHARRAARPVALPQRGQRTHRAGPGRRGCRRAPGRRGDRTGRGGKPGQPERRARRAAGERRGDPAAGVPDAA